MKRKATYTGENCPIGKTLNVTIAVETGLTNQPLIHLP